MPKEYARTRRIGEQIRRDLAELLRDRLDDPRMTLVSITAVDVTRDLGHARVFVTVIGTDPELRSEVVEHLNSVGGYLRGELGRALHLRAIPQLHFRYDESIERGAHLSALIERARAEDEAHRAMRGEEDMGDRSED